MSFPSTATFRTGANFPVANVSAPPSVVANAQKLSLSPSTPVGTKMSVNDGFVLSGTGNPELNSVFFFDIGDGGFGKHSYFSDRDGTLEVTWDGNEWYILGSDYYFESDDDVQFPWQVVTWTVNNIGTLPLPTLTHPAIQQLSAPDTSQGGVAVLGGTQDGAYSTAPFGQNAGKDYFALLGTLGDDPSSNTVAWWDNINDNFGAGPSSAGFGINHNGVLGYYSLSNVPTPDLATNWKNSSDDTPAPITVTSVSVAQLVAGARIGSTTYAVSGNANGRNVLSDVLGVALPIQWTGSAWENEAVVNTGNVAFPWLGAPVQAITQDNVASEANWIASVDSEDSFFPAPPIHF